MDPDAVIYRRTQLVGYCLNIVLFGILTAQTYLYYLAFPNDKNVTKAIVAFIYSIDTAQTILALLDFYKIFCINLRADFLWLTIPLSCTMVATVAQLFYAHRIYILSRKKIVAGIVVTLALMQLTSGLITTAFFYDPSSIEDILGYSITPVSWGAAGMTCDVVIAVYMFWFLTIQMKRASRMTQATLTRMKRLLLETGLLTAILATAFAVLLPLVAFNAFTIPGLCLGKIYSNSMLVLLNNRFVIAGGRNEPTFQFEIDSYHLVNISRAENAGHGIREEEQME